MFVNWPIYRVEKFDSNIRNPDQVVSGEKYWFFKFWPDYVEVDVIGVKNSFLLYPLENLSRIYLQHLLGSLNRIKDYDFVTNLRFSKCFFIRST
jgi:hypothetical protein